MLYLSVRTCAMIGPFSAPQFTLRLAKFKSLFSAPKCLFKKNFEQTSAVCLPPKALKGRPAPKRFHVLFSSRQQTSTQCQPVFNPFVQSAPSNPPGNFPGNATNTNNRMLIIRKILVLFSIALIKFIHSFDVDIDIEQSKPLVRTFYAETRCALLISGISKTLEKELLKTFLSQFLAKKNLRLRQQLFSCNFALLY